MSSREMTHKRLRRQILQFVSLRDRYRVGYELFPGDDILAQALKDLTYVRHSTSALETSCKEQEAHQAHLCGIYKMALRSPDRGESAVIRDVLRGPPLIHGALAPSTCRCPRWSWGGATSPLDLFSPPREASAL